MVADINECMILPENATEFTNICFQWYMAACPMMSCPSASADVICYNRFNGFMCGCANDGYEFNSTSNLCGSESRRKQSHFRGCLSDKVDSEII